MPNVPQLILRPTFPGWKNDHCICLKLAKTKKCKIGPIISIWRKPGTAVNLPTSEQPGTEQE